MQTPGMHPGMHPGIRPIGIRCSEKGQPHEILTDIDDPSWSRAVDLFWCVPSTCSRHS